MAKGDGGFWDVVLLGVSDIFGGNYADSYPEREVKEAAPGVRWERAQQIVKSNPNITGKVEGFWFINGKPAPDSHINMWLAGTLDEWKEKNGE